MKEQLAKLKYDNRMQNFYLKSGELSPSDLQSYIQGLPDDQGGSKELSIFSAGAAAPVQETEAAPAVEAPDTNPTGGGFTF